MNGITLVSLARSAIMNLWIGHKQTKGTKTITKQTEKNYTEAQEKRIAAVAAEGPINQAVATALAQEFGKNPRSVIAKVVRMNLPYQKKAPVSKTGEPVMRKETIVEEISRFVPGNLEGLEKASKSALANVLATLQAGDAAD